MMEESAGNAAKPTFAFWVIASIALLWNLIGLYQYYVGVTLTSETLAARFTPEQVAIIEATPVWVTSATAIAVTAGVIASILLLLRLSLAVPLFIVSLIALIVQDIYVFGMSDSLAAFGVQPLILQGIVLLIALFLVAYSRTQRLRGVLR
jgi:hypothetical protein